MLIFKEGYKYDKCIRNNLKKIFSREFKINN